MAAKIQDGVQKSIKTSQKHIFAFTCLKFGSYVVQRVCTLTRTLDIKHIQHGG